MSKYNLKFDGQATHYCRYCNTWDTPSSSAEPGDADKIICGNCGRRGYLVANPFPDNMLPYVELDHSPEALPSNNGLGGDTGTLPSRDNKETIQ